MSIQDDIFDLENYFADIDKPEYQEMFDRVRDWAIDCENECERLRPIVNHMKEAVSLMFQQEQVNDEN